jgi:hypothetical protein
MLSNRKFHASGSLEGIQNRKKVGTWFGSSFGSEIRALL